MHIEIVYCAPFAFVDEIRGNATCKRVVGANRYFSSQQTAERRVYFFRHLANLAWSKMFTINQDLLRSLGTIGHLNGRVEVASWCVNESRSGEVRFSMNRNRSSTSTGQFIIHIYQPLRSGRIWHKVNFLSWV